MKVRIHNFFHTVHWCFCWRTWLGKTWLCKTGQYTWTESYERVVGTGKHLSWFSKCKSAVSCTKQGLELSVNAGCFIKPDDLPGEFFWHCPPSLFLCSSLFVLYRDSWRRSLLLKILLTTRKIITTMRWSWNENKPGFHRLHHRPSNWERWMSISVDIYRYCLAHNGLCLLDPEYCWEWWDIWSSRNIFTRVKGRLG